MADGMYYSRFFGWEVACGGFLFLFQNVKFISKLLLVAS